MRHPWLKVIAGCSVLIGIILFCVIVGGYSNFSRALNRIETSTSLLTDACQNRLDLLPGLVELTKKTAPQNTPERLTQTAEKASLILQQVISRTLPVETNLMEAFERSQTDLTFQLKDTFTQLELVLDKENSEKLESLRIKFNTAQDNLFVIKKSYTSEVLYFNSRTTVFPGFLIAKLFGFNKIKYAHFSEDAFLPARKAFTAQTS